TLSSTLSSVYTSTSSRSTVTTTEVSKITITPTPTTNNNNWNQYFNQDNLHSMIDKLKDTEEGIVDNVSDLINGLLNEMLPGGVILVFILVGLAVVAIVSTIAYRKWQARQRGLQRF
ncbi:hypothetical protein C6P44_003893, partial [Monosporozyma unispora]